MRSRRDVHRAAPALPVLLPHWRARACSVLLAATGVFLTLCLLTYHPADVPWLSSHPHYPPANLGGTMGVWLGFLGRGGFGWGSLFVSLICFVCAWGCWRAHPPVFHGWSILLASLCLTAGLGTVLALTATSDVTQTERGGIAGFLLARAGIYYLGTVGTLLTAFCVSVLSWLVISGQTLGTSGLGWLKRGVARVLPGRRKAVAVTMSGGTATPLSDELERTASPRSWSELPARARASGDRGQPSGGAAAAAEGAGRTPAAGLRVRLRSTIEPKPKMLPTPSRRQAPGGFQLPPLDLLVTPPPIAERRLTEDLQMNARVLEETLQEFGVEAQVVNVDRGPTVTRYELTPSPGVKLTRIVSLADDLALVMKAASCHVVAPIPGKGRVGVDVPNTTSTVVYLKEIITAHEFTGNSSPVAMPIGKDVSGQALVMDLRDCPHLLIAGATGSGKTVCLNSLLVGILTHASPDQVKFLMIDPKMVELALFNDIPHLVAPVVTSAKKASVALAWAVEEMERRYQLLARAGVRNLDLYNKRLAAPGPKPLPQETADEPGDGEELRPLPYLVIVIDELADLMMVAAQDVESAITRLAQLSRAVGIHIVLATQRPSVDVITGVIKANFPTRLAFQVASKVDSRTILDTNGADKLLGRGDLLFLRPGTAKPIRAQGAFVTDAEIERVTNFLKQQRPPAYDERFLEKDRQPETLASGERDELYEMARRIVMEAGQASTSLLQRRLRLGYGRAARMLDLMEQEGLVGPPQGSRPREVLVSRDTVGQGS